MSNMQQRLLCFFRRRTRRIENKEEGEEDTARPPSKASPSVDDGTMSTRQHRLLCCLRRRIRRRKKEEEEKREEDTARPPAEEKKEEEKREEDTARPPSEASPSMDGRTMSKMLPQKEEEEEEEEDRSNPPSEAPPSMDGMLHGDIREEGALLTADTPAVKERSPDNSSVGSLCSFSSLKEATEKSKKLDLKEKEQQDDWSLESILGDSWASDLGSNQLQMPETPSSGPFQENPNNTDILQQILKEVQEVRSQLENQKHLHDSQMSLLRFEWKKQKEQQREQQKEKDGRKQLKTMLEASETAARLKIAELERQTQKLEVENGTLLTKCHHLEGRVAIVERQLDNLLREGWSTDAFLKRKFPVPEESNSQSRRDPTQRSGLKKSPERHMEKNSKKQYRSRH